MNKVAGDAHAAISLPHVAGGSPLDRILLEYDLLPDALQSKSRPSWV